MAQAATPRTGNCPDGRIRPVSFKLNIPQSGSYAPLQLSYHTDTECYFGQYTYGCRGRTAEFLAVKTAVYSLWQDETQGLRA